MFSVDFVGVGSIDECRRSVGQHTFTSLCNDQSSSTFLRPQRRGLTKERGGGICSFADEWIRIECDSFVVWEECCVRLLLVCGANRDLVNPTEAQLAFLSAHCCLASLIDVDDQSGRMSKISSSRSSFSDQGFNSESMSTNLVDSTKREQSLCVKSYRSEIPGELNLKKGDIVESKWQRTPTETNERTREFSLQCWWRRICSRTMWRERRMVSISSCSEHLCR